MLGKSILAGLVLAGTAGSGVYFGLAPQTAVEKPRLTKPAGSFETNIEVESPKPIAPRVKVVEAREAEHPHSEPEMDETEPDVEPAASGAEEEARPEKKWIDQYLERRQRAETRNADKDEDQEVQENEAKVDIEADVTEDKRNFFRSEEDDDTARTVWSEEIVMDHDGDTDAIIADVERILKQLRVEKGESASERSKVRVIRKTKKSAETSTDAAYETISLVLDEAKDIQSVELRDRAYLSVVKYALSHKYFGEAKNAMFLINQEDLREKARSKIAAHYAATGNPDAAFEMTESVDDEDQRDALRLRIIKALMAGDAH